MSVLLKTGLQRLLKPRHIAFIGGTEAAEALQQCQKIGFQGDLWPVNPNRSELAEISCFAKVEDLPEPPDAAFIAVPPDVTIQTVARLANQGVGGVVCYAAGFAEAGETGKQRQQQLIQAAGAMALLGPNCYGLLNYLDSATLWPDVHGGSAVASGVAILTQSGNMGINMTLQQRSLPLAYMISLGNSAVLQVPELIENLILDRRITAIGLHIESLHDIPAFAKAAQAALKQRIPIVALKAGRSVVGARATLSHTSSLAGSEQLYQALFKRYGVAQVQTLPELLETLKFLHVHGTLTSSNIASLSSSGGEASLIADLAESLGIEFAPLDKEQKKTLTTVLSDRVIVDNPLDYHTYIWGDLTQQNACFQALMQGRQAANLLLMDYPKAGADQAWLITEQAFTQARDATESCALVVSSLPENLPQTARERLLAQNIAPMQGFSECLVAIRAAALIGQTQQQPNIPALAQRFKKEPGAATVLNEWQAKQALAEYGLPLATGQLCTAADAVEIANMLGFPVVMKAVAAELAHKTEAGAVLLNLQNADQVHAAAERLQALSTTLLVECMIKDAIAELIVGITCDPHFGKVLVLGSGGIQAELLQDVQQILLPCRQEEIAKALHSLKLAPLLHGYRGRPKADLAAAINAIDAVIRYAEAHADQLLELDVNPLLLRPQGQGCAAVDVLIRLRN